MNLREKYRPKVIEDFAGNNSIVDTFVNDISRKEKRGYFISGPHGAGKTSLARMGCKLLAIEAFDMHEINASDDRGIDTVRRIKEECALSSRGNRGWIIDEAHETTKGFQNALLKLLEEGSEKDHFFICTTDSSKVLNAVQSRCGKYPLKLASFAEVKARLKHICRSEKTKISPEVLELIVEKSGLHLRDAVNLLESVIDKEEKGALDYLSATDDSSADQKPEAINLVRAIYAKDWKKVQENLKKLKDAGDSPEGLRRFVLLWGSGTIIKSTKMPSSKFDPLRNTVIIMEWFEAPLFDQGTAWPMFILNCKRSTM